MLTTLNENSAPEDFAGRGDALISPFFKSIGKRVGGSPQKRVLELKDSVKRKYGRYSLAQMFRLADTQFDGLLTEAGIDMQWSRDVFAALGEDLGAGRWSVRAQVRPLINYVWLAALLMAIGGVIAALDRRYRRRGEAT